MTYVMLAAAMEYASRGVPVFPVHGVANGRCECGKDCASPGKHPAAALVRTGVKDTTTDISLIQNWGERYPTANMATPTSWTTVLDVDPRNTPPSLGLPSDRRYDLETILPELDRRIAEIEERPVARPWWSPWP